MLDFLPSKVERVLDIGCAEGDFGAAVKREKSAEVWGVEIDPAAARIAETKLDRVIRGDALDVLASLPDGFFDCVVMNDVLEHLAWPELLLERLRPKLAPDSVLVASIPNVRFYTVIWDLVVRGEWRYQEFGVMDRTHLRFFTRRSIERLFRDQGYRVLQIAGLRPRKHRRFYLMKILSFGGLEDARFPQFACVAVPNLQAESRDESTPNP
jgi:2-polyprenyl-3-methyl-5-hydroxy-6-metoxy-1,4-benzoquinol methylase